MNILNLKRVFIHEVGHFIARELNYKHYKIGLGTEQIYIEPCRLPDTTDYSGGATAIKPKGYIENGEVQNPTEYMAVILYGCVLQTLYLKSKEDIGFRTCFNIGNLANGKLDALEFRAMEEYCTGPKRKKIVEFIEKEYLSNLFTDQNHLKKLFELDPLKFIDNRNDKLYVNLPLLKQSLEEFMTEHLEYYSVFVKTIKRIENGK
ncbi:hypothetical protein [[Muricauda] lutisoli]|uniref:Peptidase M41 domain-containing protein n=1 Tax=[Muricauda] lutisoli TaxID=2816035 RepID=A0ABS3EUH6_9FLAO|nr:hypothetical protein [[Muricauda] lutisoli]MBO0329844.1 hypothetical protein [[Muricauda] lutisoli]